MLAARVAADLQVESNVEIMTTKGGLGEFSVWLDGNVIVKSNRLLSPNPARVVDKVRDALATVP